MRNLNVAFLVAQSGCPVTLHSPFNSHLFKVPIFFFKSHSWLIGTILHSLLKLNICSVGKVYITNLELVEYCFSVWTKVVFYWSRVLKWILHVSGPLPISVQQEVQSQECSKKKSAVHQPCCNATVIWPCRWLMLIFIYTFSNFIMCWFLCLASTPFKIGNETVISSVRVRFYFSFITFLLWYCNVCPFGCVIMMLCMFNICLKALSRRVYVYFFFKFEDKLGFALTFAELPMFLSLRISCLLYT